jgi:hypothetical protein
MPSLNRGTIAKIESGVRKNVGADEIATLSKVLGVSPTDLLGEGSTGAQPDASKQAGPPVHAVPAYVGSAPFTGRARDLAVLDEWGRSADPVMVVEAMGGTGKSALAWQWVQDRAPAVIEGLSGRLWWSFYEGSPSMTRFLQELLGYVSSDPEREIRRLRPADLADQVLARLRSRPYLVVLDGFERLLAAYDRFDPPRVRDGKPEAHQRSLIEANGDEVVRRLAAAGPSKILISTRLMPLALHGRFGQQMPGVRQLRLPGLTDADTHELLGRLGVQGSGSAIADFFSHLGNHPLLVGVVAGLVRDYRAAPGDFDRWLADQTAGGALSVPGLDLTHRRTHVLAAALDELEPGPQRLLGSISVLPDAVDWDTLSAINPFKPEPSFAPPPSSPDRSRDQVRHDASEQSMDSPAPQAASSATAQLDAALTDLEERGLLWWDRSSNTYHMHPIIRAYAYDQLARTTS